MTDPQPSSGFPPLLPLKTGAEIYDGIMGAIEPELTTAQAPLLEEKYKDETPEQKKARGERYQKAFEEYEKRYQDYLMSEETKVRQFKRQIFRSVEERTGDDDRAKLRQMDLNFAS